MFFFIFIFIFWILLLFNALNTLYPKQLFFNLCIFIQIATKHLEFNFQWQLAYLRTWSTWHSNETSGSRLTLQKERNYSLERASCCLNLLDNRVSDLNFLHLNIQDSTVSSADDSEVSTNHKGTIALCDLPYLPHPLWSQGYQAIPEWINE